MKSVRLYPGRIFAGLMIILIGVLFLLANIGKLDIGDLFATYWPLILVFFGLWHLISDGFRQGFGLLLLLIGLFFLLLNLDVISGRIWVYFWPLLIIAAGLWLIFKPRIKGFRGKAPKIKDDDLSAFVMFSGAKRLFESQEFRGGKATAIFGGIELDFTRAKLAGNEATVELTALFGGIDLRIPREWKVIIDSSALLGGVGDKHRPVPSEEIKGTLFIKATTIFGGIDIKS